MCEEETEADETVPPIQIILVKPIEGQSLTLLRQFSFANQAFVFTDFCPTPTNEFAAVSSFILFYRIRKEGSGADDAQ